MNQAIGNKQQNNRFGFTLIELLVVISITAIIAATTLANYREGEKRRRVSLASDGIISALTTAQSYALGGKSTNNALSTCRTAQYYYISFTYSSTYTLQAYNNCNTTDSIQTFNLPDRARIKVNGMVLAGVAANVSLKVSFTPPYGQIKGLRDADPQYTTFTTTTITIESPDGNISKTVTIDGSSGRIQ